MNVDKVFDDILAAARSKDRVSDLCVMLGNPSTIGEARRFWRSLPGVAGWRDVDRLTIELEFLDPIEWGACVPPLSATADALAPSESGEAST